jgi:hypothetical protein
MQSRSSVGILGIHAGEDVKPLPAPLQRRLQLPLVALP